MIVNIPSLVDFEANGLAFLNLAWESVLELSKSLTESSEYQAEYNEVTDEELVEFEEIVKKYWEQEQPRMAVAVALAHQAAEFLIKARITSVSPFLLIAGEPSKWPSGCDNEDKSFADFKTVDAQDLLRLHDSVYSLRLSEEFARRFEELRKHRNTVMHSVDNRKLFTVKDGVLAVLEISDALCGENNWHRLRKQYLEGKVNYWDPYGYSEFNPAYPFATETLHVIDELLKPAEVKRFYGFDPKQRRYICFDCCDDHADEVIKSRLLQPNTSDSTTVACFCCLQSYPVIRKDCTVGDCKGNVLDPNDSNRCMTCGDCSEEQDA
jgi:hypothetical protein